MSEEKYDGEERRQEWHQTKGLSISIIALLVGNIVTTVWWAATLTGDVKKINERPDLTERVIKLEAKQEANQQYLNRLASILDKVSDTVTRIDKEQARRGKN